MIEEKNIVVEPGEVSTFLVDTAPVKVLLPQEQSVAKSACAVTLIAGLHSGWFGAILPAIAISQNLPLEKTGVLVSSASAGALAALALSNLIVAKIGGARASLLAIALAASGFIGLAGGSSLTVLIAFALCLGFGFGLNGIVSHILFPLYFPHRIASSLSKLNVYYGVGALIGPLVTLAVFTLGASYRFIFVAAGLSVLAVGVNLYRSGLNPTQVKSKNARPDHPTKGVGSLLGHPILLALTAINFLYVGLESSLGTWVYTFLQRADNCSGPMASAGISLLWAGLTVGRMVSARACLKINPKYISLAAMLTLVGAIFALANWQSGAVGALTLVFAIGLGLGPIFPTIIAQSAIRFPQSSAAITSIIIASGYVGGIILPWLAGNSLVSDGAAKCMIAAGLTAALMPLLLRLSLFRGKQPT